MPILCYVMTGFQQVFRSLRFSQLWCFMHRWWKLFRSRAFHECSPASHLAMESLRSSQVCRKRTASCLPLPRTLGLRLPASPWTISSWQTARSIQGASQIAALFIAPSCYLSSSQKIRLVHLLSVQSYPVSQYPSASLDRCLRLLETAGR